MMSGFAKAEESDGFQLVVKGGKLRIPGKHVFEESTHRREGIYCSDNISSERNGFEAR